MNMKTICFFLLFFITNGLLAQDTTSSVIIHKDPRIDLMIKKVSDMNLAARKASARFAKGYRLMVINTNNRDEAIQAKSKIYTNFPGLKAYMVYQSPYFKLKVGNFKTREEAEKYLKDLSIYFSKGVFVVNDTIEIKPEKEND